jgi:hypothetical protein
MAEGESGSSIAWSEELGRHVRVGPVEDHGIAPVELIDRAIRAGEWGEAAHLLEFFMEIGAVRFASYHSGRWLKIDKWLAAHGTEPETVAAERLRLLDALGGEVGRFDPAREWLDLNATAGELAGAMRAGLLDEAEALAAVERLRSTYRRVHDFVHDIVCGLLAFVVEHHGEPALGECMRFVLEGTTRAPEPEQSVRYVIDGMLGHLSGAGRRGGIEVTDLDDRWQIEFDPCGSGGRSYADQEESGSPWRAEQEPGFDLLSGAYDWTWNQTGVCQYCTHCAIGMQQIPIEQHGAPVVDVEPPRGVRGSPEAERSRCRFTVYKSIDSIPASAFERVGLQRP